MNIPNTLTVFRFLLIPVFIYFFFSDLPNNYVISAIIFILAGITDILDGYIARKFNIVTKWGKLMDPLADKSIQLTVFFCLAYIKLVPLWAIIIVVAKELLMIIGGIVLYKDKIVVGASWYGKVSTCMFYVSILTVIIFKDSLTDLQRTLLIVIAIIGTLFAFIRYSFNFRKIKYSKVGQAKIQT